MLTRLQALSRTLSRSPERAQLIRAVKMSSFILPDSKPEVKVNLTQDITKDELLSWPAFKTWSQTLLQSLELQHQASHTFHEDPYYLRQIDIQAVDLFGGKRIGFVKLKADVSNSAGEKLPGSVFLRGGSVGMLLILQSDDVPAESETDKHVILCVQPRVPAGSLAFVELPAGMIDDAGTFGGAAAKEIKEETGLEIPESELINMTEAALPRPAESKEQLQSAFYPSCGGSDEYIPLFFWQKRVPRDQLAEWEGKLTGLRDRGEKITLMLARLEDVWKVGGRDGKVLAGWALYQGLKSEGKL